MNLNSNNNISLFEQIKADMKEKISTGVYKAGEKIPTESELIDLYNVSRITVRRAVNDLSKEGILNKKQGKGTFVQEKKIWRKISHAQSFTQACKASGMTPMSIITERQIIPVADLDIPEKNLLGDNLATFIQRIRYADGTPVFCENNYYPYPRFAFLMDEDLSGSLYDLLEKKYHVELGSPKNSYIDVKNAGVKIGKLLNISVSEPVFSLSTEMYDTSNQLIHIGKQFIVGSRYRFYLDE